MSVMDRFLNIMKLNDGEDDDAYYDDDDYLDEEDSKDDKVLNPSHPLVLLTLSVATSIDAMAVGVSFVGMGLLDFSDIIEAIVVIGIVSFLFSVCGKYIGVRLGQHFNWPVEILGGIILIGIGIKVLCEHLIV